MCNQTNNRWGIIDTIDNCWMGSKEGPLLFGDEDFAKIAAAVVNERMGTLTRYRPQPFADEECHYKDEVPTKYSSEEAIARIERRA